MDKHCGKTLKNMTPKPGMFMPFGAGAHMCPGNEFVKLEMSVFMHYAVLGYE
jgi:ent-kaurenoic acid hydroxylase